MAERSAERLEWEAVAGANRLEQADAGKGVNDLALVSEEELRPIKTAKGRESSNSS
jgi:hypothetical protein